jgi:hypothetical protein
MSRAASAPSMIGMWMSMSTRSKPCLGERSSSSRGRNRLGPVSDMHHADAGILQGGAGEQRVDVVFLREQDRNLAV